MLGKTISHYKVLEKIGQGGMGEVYRATDTKLNRDVALKILPEQFASDTQRMARFQREAEVLASLDHPNIGQIYGIENAGETKALVLQLIEGPTLAERITQGPIPVEEALKITLQMAEGSEAAHEKGVIHRDLKPANVKITPEGQVKILDFGLAKALEVEVADSSLSQSPTLTNAATQAGVILGTAAYMSPEQARGKPTDRRADIWAIGVVLFEMLSGKRAFEGEDVSQTLAAVIMIEPDWSLLPSETPGPILRLLQRCLDREPHDRLQAIGEFRIAVSRYLTNPVDPLAQPVATAVQAQPRPILPRVLAAVVLSALIAAVVVWNLEPEPPRGLSRFVISASPSAPVSVIEPRSGLAISPNGRQIAYLGPAEGGFGLYLRAVDRLEGTLIASRLDSPFFSPDGGWIGFRKSDLVWKKASILGGPEVTICDQCQTFGAARGVSWGPDNNIILAGVDPTTGLVQVPASGGEPEVLTTPESGQDHFWPEILPDGRAVLFTVYNGSVAESQIAVLNLETQEQRVLIQGGSNPRYASTGHIVYGVDGTLRAVAFDAERLAVSGEPVPVLEGVVTNASGVAQYGISRDGSLVYISGSSAADIRSLAFQGNGTVQLLNVPSKQYLSPRLSPDGQKVAVQTVEDEGNVIWLYDVSGDSAIRRLTFLGEGDNYRPIWTPDSQRVTFSSDREGTMSIYWMPADGSGVAERLSSAEDGTSHWPGSWSPDGQTLAYMIERERQTDWDIWLLSREDQESRSLYDEPGRVYLGPEFSPDGRWLTYASGEAPAASELYLEPFPPTGARWRLSPGGGIFPVWSRNGNEIVFRPTTNESRGTLKSVAVVTEPEVNWANEQTLPVRDFIVVSYYRDYDTSQDGQILTVVPAQQEEDGEKEPQQVVMVLNWFEELKRLVPTN